MSAPTKPYAGDPDCPACHGAWAPGDCSYCFCDHGQPAHADCEDCKLQDELFDAGPPDFDLVYLPLREAVKVKRARGKPS